MEKAFLLLQDYGFEVILVNAAHIKNVRGKKSDVIDCQWIWQLHTAGLLHASFQSDQLTEQLLTFTRHRKSLIEGASRYVSKMQKTNRKITVLDTLRNRLVISHVQESAHIETEIGKNPITYSIDSKLRHAIDRKTCIFILKIAQRK